MTGTEIYKRTPAYEREAPSIRLHAPQWKLLLAYDGQRGLAEVALSVEISFADALPLTEQYLDRGWIEEQPITLDQYLKRTGVADVSGIGSAVMPSVVLHEPKREASAPAPASAPGPRAAERSTAVLPQVQPSSAPGPRAKGPLRIGAVVDYVLSTVGNSALGQLVVYRIFLRVPPELLQTEDIVSVHLVNDPSVVKSEPLKQSIMKAVNEVLKKPLPDSVFAPA